MLRRLFLATSLALATPGFATEPDPTIEELLLATDDVARGESSIATLQMHVKTKRYERTMSMQAWSEGTEKSLIRILSPAKDAGISTLKDGDNLWNYLPKVDKTMKVPAGMMSGSWMGSHMSNDDLVQESRLSEDYTYTLTGRPQDGVGSWVVELVPKPDAPVVWGKVVATISTEKLPEKIEYFDEKGELVRTMAWSEVKDVDGRRMPTVMRVVPADKPDEYTRITYEQIDFDADIPAGTFSLQALKK